jgi:hypothetical protein
MARARLPCLSALAATGIEVIIWDVIVSILSRMQEAISSGCLGPVVPY